MTPGTILCDNEFKFSDGTVGKKLLIVLNDGEIGNYIILKTTSNSNYKGIGYGCQSDDRYPNFFLPKGSCCLNKQSWLLLDQFFEFNAGELIGRHFAGKINRIGVLPTEITKQLLECAINCQDISIKQAEILTEMLASLNASTAD